MSPEQIGALVGSIGLPGVAFFMLLRYMTTNLNGKLDRLTSAVEKNTEATHALAATQKLATKMGQ